MTNHDFQTFQRVSHQAIEESAKIILNYYHHLPPIETKPDNTPVTLADREAEEIIINTIKKTFPDHGFMGEELGDNSNGSDFTWIIDPIDGTKNFIHGINFFGTLIALKYQQEIILGITHLPALSETLFATSDSPTTLNGQLVKVSSVKDIGNSYINFSPSQLKDERGLKIFHNLLTKQVHALRGFGDCYGYHLVATGKTDVFFELNTKAWDVAAYKLIIRQAGGQHTDIYGDRDILGGTSLATNGLLHPEMLNLIKSSLAL